MAGSFLSDRIFYRIFPDGYPFATRDEFTDMFGPRLVLEGAAAWAAQRAQAEARAEAERRCAST